MKLDVKTVVVRQKKGDSRLRELGTQVLNGRLTLDEALKKAYEAGEAHVEKQYVGVCTCGNSCPIHD